jgi:GAF domain-containing protein
VNDDDIEEVHLHLVSVYAWERKKFAEKRIAKGDGLLGQVWLEKEPIYLREIPKDFVEITSGLGKATPRTLLIVPLKLNDEVFGILELASFREYEEHERDFVLKLSGLIGSTISSAKMNGRTATLLEQSQTHTEMMREQEEMMRQTMEEMQATQEEVTRKEKEYLSIIDQLQQTIASHERRIRQLQEDRNGESLREEMEKSLLRNSQKVPSLHSDI